MTKQAYNLKPYKEGWIEKFLIQLAKVPNVSLAARMADITREYAYQVRETDKAFAKAWQHALGNSADDLEERLFDHALHGVDEPVYQGGQLVGHKTVWDNRMSLNLLKTHKPEYNHVRKIEQDNSGKLEIEFVNDWRRDDDEMDKGG